MNIYYLRMADGVMAVGFGLVENFFFGKLSLVISEAGWAIFVINKLFIIHKN